ncbi:hypothetical protein P5P86_16525 [Nocardioides sp. BP30]|uniref:hypothetical protein n=1 Tax=Nocardioides sp. BP30 TaxID=3036374 RepID=UPI0024695207|nr:hypothetical protein [Nocardioides sp. BP30]WGL51560.1 hypothetical protein P5P86_16525 [Nocardioides sp. BP30]
MESRLTDVAAVRAGWGFALLFGLAALLAHTHADLAAGLFGFLGACALAALTVPFGYAVLLGLSGWGFLTGFVVNSGGQLSFAGSDLGHLALLVALSAAVAVLRPRGAAHTRAARQRRPHGSRV